LAKDMGITTSGEFCPVAQNNQIQFHSGTQSADTINPRNAMIAYVNGIVYCPRKLLVRGNPRYFCPNKITNVINAGICVCDVFIEFIKIENVIPQY
jgi:hypothetical protein